MNELIEKKVPEKRLIGKIKKLNTLCCTSQVYEIKPTIDPIHENKKLTKRI